MTTMLARNILTELKTLMAHEKEPLTEEMEALDMAIKALELQERYDDGEIWVTISRALYEKCLYALDAMEKEPSVTQKSGKWIYKEITDDYRVTGQCSECKERRIIDNFCPNCGAKMVEPQESEGQTE